MSGHTDIPGRTSWGNGWEPYPTASGRPIEPNPTRTMTRKGGKKVRGAESEMVHSSPLPITISILLATKKTILPLHSSRI